MKNKGSVLSVLGSVLLLVMASLACPQLLGQTLTFSGSTEDSANNEEATMPAVTVSAANINVPGITLVAYSSPQFESLVAASVPGNLEGALWGVMPFSVFLRNETNKAVIAYTVSWTLVDNAGQRYVHYGTVCDAIALKGLIAPHGDGLVTILGAVSASSSDDPQLLREVAEFAQWLNEQATVSIALDVVVFEDGAAAGPDPSLSMSQIKARLRSEYDLYKSVVARSDTDQTLVAWLQSLASQVKPGSTLAFGNDPFPQWYQFYQARTASALLKLAGSKGHVEAAAYIRSALRSKPYPPLIVNP